MKCKYFFLILSLFYFINTATAQTGPWAKFNAKIKGEALIRDSDGGYLKEVQSIVEGGGDVNWQTESTGLTPLMAATAGGHVEIVKFLLSNGADANRKDANGRTALQWAELVGAKAVIVVLTDLTKESEIIKPVEKEQPKITPPALPPITSGTDTDNVIIKRSAYKAWAPFGTYGVGQKVKFFIGSWKEGTVIEVGIRGDYSVKNVASNERQYLIARE